MLTELYKSGRVKENALGVLAKSILCLRTGCLATGPAVTFANTTIYLIESLPGHRHSTPQQPARQKQQRIPQPSSTQSKTPTQPPPRQQTPPQKTEKRVEEGSGKLRGDWDLLKSLVAREAQVDISKAELTLSTCLNYLSIYPSVGILRLVEDVSRMSKVEQTVVRTAVEILRSLDIVEVKEDGVVNLKRVIKRGDLPL